MASKDSSNSPDLVVGSFVSFTSRMSGEFYEGTVYFFNREDASFGIDAVSRGRMLGLCKRVEGYYQFFLKDIKDLNVIRVPSKRSTINTSTTKDDQNKNPDGSSSSTSPAQ